jgi:hypothetical protein
MLAMSQSLSGNLMPRWPWERMSFEIGAKNFLVLIRIVNRIVRYAVG